MLDSCTTIGKKILIYIIGFPGITSRGRIATRGAHTSDVKAAPVGTKIVLTCIKNRSLSRLKFIIQDNTREPNENAS